MCVWWSMRGIIHFEVPKPGQHDDADLYCEQIDRVNQVSMAKYSAIVNRKGVNLQNANARPYLQKGQEKKLMN